MESGGRSRLAGCQGLFFIIPIIKWVIGRKRQSQIHYRLKNMKEKIKQISQNTLIYGLGNTLNKFMGVFLIPMYAAFIPINQFGVMAIFEMTILFLANIITLGIPSGHEIYFFKEKENGEYGVFLFSNVLFLLIISSLILSIFILFSPQLSYIIIGDDKNSRIMVLVCVALFFDVNNQIPLHQLQYENRAVQYILQNLTRLLISLGIAVYLVVVMKLGIEGIFWGRIWGGILLFCWQLFANLIPKIIFSFQWRKVKLAISYGFPVILSSLGFLLFLMSDRYLVNIILGNADAGKYSFGYRMASIILVFTQAIGVSYLPTLFFNEKKHDNKRYYIKMLTYYSFVTSWIIMVFLFFYKIPLWPLVKNKEYWDGLMVVPVLCFAFIIQGMISFAGVGVSLTNKNRYVILPTFMIAVFNISINILLLHRFGILVAALSALVSHILLVLTNSYYSRKFYHIGFEWRKVVSAVLICSLLVFLGHTCFQSTDISRLILRLILVSLYPIVLYYLKFFEEIEILTLKNLLKSRFISFTGKK